MFDLDLSESSDYIYIYVCVFGYFEPGLSSAMKFCVPRIDPRRRAILA